MGPASEVDRQSDFEALEHAPEAHMKGANAVEIWEGARLVATRAAVVATAADHPGSHHAPIG